MFADPSVTDHKLAPGTLRRIATFAKPYRRQISYFLGLVVLDAVAGAATPLLYRAIIDDGITGQQPNLVIGLSLGVALLAVISASIGLTQRWFSSNIGEGLIHDLRTQVFDHVQSMPIGFFSRAQTGALVSRLNNDVQGAQQAFTSTLSNVVGNLIGVTTTIAAMAVLSWQITLLALTLLPLFLLPARWTGRRLAAMSRDRAQLNGEMGQTMTERFNVSGALLVKLFGRPDEESAVFAERTAKVRDIGIRSAMYGRIVMTALGLLATLATAMVYGVGGVTVISGEMQIGTLVALTAYLGRLYGPLTSLSNVQVDVMTTLVSFERVIEVLDLEPMITDPDNPIDLPAGIPSVSIQDVSFSYPTAEEVSLASLEGGRDALRTRRWTDPPRRRSARRARSDAGPRRRFRGGEVNDCRPGQQVVRPDLGIGETWRGGPSRHHTGPDPRCCRRRRPGRPPVPRHPGGQSALRQARCDGARDPHGTGGRPDPRRGRCASRRDRHRGRGSWAPAEWW